VAGVPVELLLADLTRRISVKTGPGAMAAMRLHDWIREQNGHDQK
jgi:hypothetical protein